MDTIDFMIEAFQRAKRCQTVLDNLKQATENAIWKDNEWSNNPKAKEHVLCLIKEAIQIIEKE